MKTFKQHISEGSVSNEIRDELEKLQQHWIDNSEEYIKKGVYPIIERPFDQVIRNGYMVLGVNHAVDSSRFTKIMDMLKGDAKGALYDKKNKTWPIKYDVESGKIHRGTVNTELSIFLDKNFMGKTSRPSSVSSEGRYFYHAAFNKILEKLGLGEFKPKLYSVDVVPFGSVNVGPINSEILKMCIPWFKKFLSISKPKVIFTTMGVLNTLSKHYDYQKVAVRHSNYRSDKGRIIETGYLNGIPTIALIHWSGAQGLKPHQDKTFDENVDDIRNEILSLISGKAVVSPTVTNKPVSASVKAKQQKISEVEAFNIMRSEVSKYNAKQKAILVANKDKIVKDVMSGINVTDAFKKYL